MNLMIPRIRLQTEKHSGERYSNAYNCPHTESSTVAPSMQDPFHEKGNYYTRGATAGDEDAICETAPLEKPFVDVDERWEVVHRSSECV